MKKNDPEEKIILAIDGMNLDEAVVLLNDCPEIMWVKVGLELFTKCVQKHGPLALDKLQEQLIIDGHKEFINPVDFTATFIPHDLEWLSEWEKLQQQDMH